MSSARGSGAPHGRGRGSTQLGARGRGRGASTSRVFNNVASQRSNSSGTARAGFGQPAGGSTGQANRGPNNARGNAFAQAASRRAAFENGKTGGSWQERYQKLTKAREREREDAIRTGLVADPDKPRALSDAITPVGTCPDMCAEFERAQRVVQDDVWAEEKGADLQPDELRMVKKFRRAAAGLEEQLPTDLRSPQVLKRTCDYLFEEVIGNAPSLAQVHHFVWDRTRAVRNDFSIQQLTRLDDLRIAVECYERIARFHILSLHQLASPQRPYAKYDWSQEREQLDRTLLSLMQYYEDTRGRTTYPNEAEFRAYCVIFQLRSPTPDLEDTVQAWPRSILRDKRVRKALDLYAAGCTVMHAEGPLNPRASHLLARQDWQRFWVLLASNETSYLMGCVSEVYFNSIRRTVLNALIRTFRASYNSTDWTLDALCDLLAFDDGEEVEMYCKFFGFAFTVQDDGKTYLDLSSVAGRALPQPNAEMPNQLKSMLVESKRLGRTLPAIINGMTVQQAQQAGLVVEEEHDEGMEDINDGGEDMEALDADQSAENDEDSLFIPEDKPKASFPNGAAALQNGLESQTKASPFSWGKPSEATQSSFSGPALAAQPTSSESKPKFDFLSGAGKSDTSTKSSFDFLSAPAKPAEKPQTTTSGFNFLQAGAKTSDTAASNRPAFNSPGAETATRSAPEFDFTGAAGVGSFSQASQDASAQRRDSNGKSEQTKDRAEVAPPQPNGFFSRPVQEQPGDSSLFKLAAPGSGKGASPERTASLSSPSLASPSNVPKPATVESAPEAPESPQNPFLQPPPNPAQTPPEPAPSFPNQSTKQAQPHYTAPSPDLPPSLSNKSPSPSNLNTGLRRPSTSTDTRPKKPSPLSHSFTATDDSSAPAREPPAAPPVASATDKQLTVDIPSAQRSHPSENAQTSSNTSAGELKKPVPFQRSRRRSEEEAENFDITVTRIAKELVEDPISGYLKQYVEYRASQIITSVQEEIAAENMKFRLRELRISALYRKYFKRWIGFIWQRRLAKSGKDRRQRRRKRLEEGFDDGSSHAGHSVIGDSRPGSVLGGSSWMDHQENVDAMFQRTMNSRSLARFSPGDRQARAGSKRPISSHGEIGTMPRNSAHKRLKSTSHVDDRGRVAKPTTTNYSTDDILKRSSFLGFSVNGASPPGRNTTKSNHFKLKALGVHRAEQLSAPRGTKRSRTESAQPAATSPPQLRKSASTAPSPEDSTPRLIMPPPSSTVSRAQKAKEDDDALFARIRAARESLTVGAVYMRSEVEKDEEMRRSLSASQSSNESPSMMKARAEARARACRAGSPERDVPAYRLRESKFVPRENYGKAIERSTQLRESRSRDNSRPATRPVSRLQDTIPSFSFSSNADKDSRAPNGLIDGFPNTKSQEEHSPILERAPPGYSPIAITRPAGFDFSDHTTEKPALSLSHPPAQPEPNMVSPVAPPKASDSQPLFAPKPVFGARNGFGTASALESKMSFSPQQPPPPGVESPFGLQQASNPNSFGSAFGSTAKSGFGGLPVQSFFAPQNQTIQPELIDQSLADSFGSHRETKDQAAQSPPHYSIPTQQNSYMSTQPTSLLSDDDDTPTFSNHPPRANGLTNQDEDEELLDEVTDDDGYEAPDMHANPFAVLADRESYERSRSHSQGSDDEMYDQSEFVDENGQLNGFENQEDFSNDGEEETESRYYGEEDEQGANGDIDEESDVDLEGDEEGDEFDSEDDEEDGEEDEGLGPPPVPAWQKVGYADPWRAKSTPNPALQGMGKTEDAPIELDSD